MKKLVLIISILVAITSTTLTSIKAEEIIPVNCKFDIDHKDYNIIIKNLIPISKEKVHELFKDVKILPDVELYELNPFIILAKRGEMTFQLNEKNIGYIIDTISSDTQIISLWKFFHRKSFLIEDKALFLEARKECTKLSGVFISPDIPKEFGLHIIKIDREWFLKAIIFDEVQSAVLKCKYRFTPEGNIGRKIDFLIKGPIVIYGCDARDPMFKKYQKGQNEFRKAVSKLIGEER